MMYAASSIIYITFFITCVRSYPGYWTRPNLNPVHGLYVKPSSDGVTGDLFVAATEDNGVKTQWAADRPINILPYGATSQPHPTAIPLPYPSFPTPHDESSPQKRAVIPSPVPSSPMQYAYALPIPSSEGSPVVSYPYAYPVLTHPSETSTPKCESSPTVPQYPFQFPFQFFYPQMMSNAYSNAMTILKDAGFSEDSANSVVSHTTPMWPPTSYAYPMYVMVDPNAWTQNQSITTTPSTPTSSPSTQNEESTPA